MKRHGICFVCGESPTGRNAWANLKRTLCRPCSRLSGAAQEEMRTAALAGLQANFLELQEEIVAKKGELLEMASRIDVLESNRKGARK